MPVTMPAPGPSLSYRSHAASVESSRNGEPGIEQAFDAFAHEELALLFLALAIFLAAALAHESQAFFEFVAELFLMGAVGLEVFRNRGLCWSE